jgi:CubicO group peptidase (beta-lactamase class C family)
VRNVLASSVLVVLAACGGQSSPLDDALSGVIEAAKVEGANCLVIERGGEVLAEWRSDDLAEGALQEGFSTTKSLAATLIGIAQDEGFLSVDDPASRFITEWAGTPSESVTIRQLLSNTSGRYFDVLSDYARLAFLEQDKSGYAISLGQSSPPGETWVYNNAAVQTLEVVLKRATNLPVEEFARTRLFEPVGMTSRLSTDAFGNQGLFAGMQTNCVDLTKLVRLYLDGGKVGDRQVVSAAFVAEALQPSSDLNDGYGFLWWLNVPGRIVRADGSGTNSGEALQPGAPKDMFWASGACGQVAMGFPSSDLIISLMRPVEVGGLSRLAGCGGAEAETVAVDGHATLVEVLGE